MIDWRPDVLGDEFECTDIALGADEEGTLFATLVRALPTPLGFWQRTFGKRRELEDTDVLYVHGWSDYFFQKRLARFFTDRGARFFALDLRKYGRSLREGQTPGFTLNLNEYDQEIDLALAIMRAETSTPRRLVMLGHSTGGLVLSLWADRHRGEADALVLNSPWLDLQLGSALRAAMKPVVDFRARISPQHAAFPQLDLGFYKRAQGLISDPSDVADINPEWRPDQAPPVLSGWLGAILDGHTRVEAGLDIGAPACVLLSTRSSLGLSWREEMLHSDSVLEVDGIARAALHLGPSVTVERIDGALHDVFVSEPRVRDHAYARLEGWLRGWRASSA